MFNMFSLVLSLFANFWMVGNEYSNIKNGQEINSGMRKMWGNLKSLHDHDKFDNLTKSLKITHFGA